MAENLLRVGEFYYHPLTRKARRPHRAIMWPDGEVTEVKNDFKLEFKDTLSPEDVVRYYYQSVAQDTQLTKIQRDVGGVKYMVNQLGLDVTLFSIDALVNDYMSADDRAGTPPQLVAAYDYAQLGKDQLGRVKLVATQYGVDEHAVGL